MKLGRLLLLGGLLAAEPAIPLVSRVAAKEVIVDYGKIYGEMEKLDSVKTVLIKEMGKEKYRRLNAMKAVIEFDTSKERVRGPFGEEKAIRFEDIANYLQYAGIFKVKLDTGGYEIAWSDEAKEFLGSNGYDPEGLGSEMVKKWLGGESLGAPYYRILKSMAEQVAQTDNPQEDAKILEQQLGEKYKKTLEIDEQMYALYSGKFGKQAGEEYAKKPETKPEDETKKKEPSTQQPDTTQVAGTEAKKPEEKKPEEGKQAPEEPKKPTPLEMVNVFFGRAEKSFKGEDYKNAAEYYGKAVTLYFDSILNPNTSRLRSYEDKIGSSPSALYLRGSKTLSEGMVAYNSGNLDSARTLFKKALKDFERIKKPDNQDTDPSEKKKLCNKMLDDIEQKTAQPQSAEDQANKLFVEGKNAYDKLNYEEAKTKFEEAKKKYEELNNTSMVAECKKYIEMINALLKQQEEQAAREKKSNDAKQIFEEGNDRLAKGEYEAAISAFDGAKKLYESLGDTSKVAECNGKINFCNGKLLYAQGEKLYNQGEYEKAKTKFEEAQFCFEVAEAKKEAEECKKKIDECKSKLEPKVELTEQANKLVGIMKEKSEGGKTAWDYFAEKTKGKSENKKNEILNQIAEDMSSTPEQWITYRVLINNIDAALEK
ncbi:MAG: hypothetical protein ACPL06_04095 [Candidatus Anstonellales archaeon]